MSDEALRAHKRATTDILGLLARVPAMVEREQEVLQNALAALQLSEPQPGPDSQLAGRGALVLAVNARRGNVIVQFGKAVSWIGLTPTHARQVAAALVSNADLAAGVTSGGTHGQEGTEAQDRKGDAEEEGSSPA